MHDNLIREREGGRLPLEVRLGSQVDIVTQMTKWTRNINLTLNIGLRVPGLSFGFSGSPCFFKWRCFKEHVAHILLLVPKVQSKKCFWQRFKECRELSRFYVPGYRCKVKIACIDSNVDQANLGK